MNRQARFSKFLTGAMFLCFVLAALAARGYVAPGGLFVAEMTRTQQPDVAPAWEVCRDRVYGQTRLVVYRRREQTAG